MSEWLYYLKPACLVMVSESSMPEEAENEEAARTIMENDPAVKHDVMTATLYPGKIALMRAI